MPLNSTKTRWLTHYVVPTLILVGSCAAFYILGARPDVPRKPKPLAQATVVEVAVAEPLDGPLVIETTGEVVPHRVVSLASEVAGRIVWKHPHLRVGEQVQAGDTLIKIDPQRFALEVQRLEIEENRATTLLEHVRQNQANVAGQLSLARKSNELQMAEVTRAKQLYESNAFSASELGALEKLEVDSRLVVEQLDGQQRSLQIELAQQDLARKLVSVQLQQAKLDQAAAEVNAPVSGIVVAVPQEEHAMLQVGDPLAVIEEAGRLEVHCHLKLSEMAWVWESLEQKPLNAREPESEPRLARLAPVRAEVIYNIGGQSHTVKGQLVRQHGAGLDPNTRTVACRVLVEQSTSSAEAHDQAIPLMTGMFVTVQVQCHPNHPLLKIPERGIRTNGCVWLMRDGELCSVPVKTVQTRDGVTIVDTRSSGIVPRDRVIVSPIANAHPGLAVRVQDVTSRETQAVSVGNKVSPAVAEQASTIGGGL